MPGRCGRALVRTACALALGAGTARAQSADRVGGDTVLARLVTFQVRNATLSDALARLRHEQRIPLAYSADLLPADRRVTLTIEAEPLHAALRALLTGSGLEIAVTREGTVVIIPPPPAATRAADGAPVGTDRAVSAVPAAGEVERARLATGVRELDQIVVMGSAVAGGPEREQPTAIDVVTAEDLAAASHTRVADLMRTMVPGVVLWDRGPGGPPPRIASVRGVTSFATRGLKTYVDGVELASPDRFTLLDGRSIERIEVIRGPQGAALYGPDALSGILQIETRKGTPGTRSARARGAVTAGPFERPDRPTAVLWQDHALGLTGGTRRTGYDVGGSFAQAGSRGETPWLRSWTANGGTRALLGPVVLSASARTGRYEYGEERRIQVQAAETLNVPQVLEERALSLTLVRSVAPGWRQTLIAGHHYISGAREESQPLVLAPRLPLGATHETASRTSVRYSSTWDLALGPNEAALSAGAEYSRRTLARAVRRTELTRSLLPLYRDALRSTGAFGQARLRLGDRLVVSGGGRAEWSSSAGAAQGAAWASTVGASWSHPVGRTTLRLRAAWGRGLRPPEPGMSRAMATATIQQLANPDLAPERQSGVETGVDLFAGEGTFAKVTWYYQRANDLIQQVQVRADGATRAYEFQNVGAITNQGVELEGGVRWSRVRLTGVLYLTRSEVRRLAPRYTGDLRPGDPVPEVPASTGAVSVRSHLGRIQAEVGGSWLGPWTGYDWAAVARVASGTEPKRATARDYRLRYPGVVRPYLAVSSDLGDNLSAFLRVDNPAKQARFIQDNVAPPLGRTTLLGLVFQP